MRNNIFAFAKEQQLQATRVEPHRSFTFEHNIVYWTDGRLLGGPWDQVNHLMRSNCFWRVDGASFDFAGHSLRAWQEKGHEAGSIVGDPGFRDPAHGDFRVRESSPALGIGFRPFDPRQAGVYGEAAWIELATGPASRERSR